ncbi:MAG: efflux RND transporter permease subunit, partial [Planctomycetota bacterium]
PEEIEESLAIKVEDKLADLDEIDELRTTISEGGGGVVIEFVDGTDLDSAVDEVERAIDALQDLPEEAERMVVAEFEPRLPVIMLTLFGEADELARKQAISCIREDLETFDGMGEIDVSDGIRDYEIRVDVSSGELLRHGLSLPQVSDAVGAWMRDVPGGTVRTNVGNVNVRMLGVRERAAAIRDIVIKATPDGQALRVGDVATVTEDFVDQEVITRFRDAELSGAAANLTIFKVGDQDAVKIAEMVRAYVIGMNGGSFEGEAELEDRVFAVLNAARNAISSAPESAGLRTARRRAFDLGRTTSCSIPQGCSLAVHSDLARFIEGRLNLLTRNAAWGGLLVFSTLLVFLNWRVALWVGMGLTIALCGTLLLMRVTGITLNLLTMFGMIVVLGLLVDDAIVVAENIQARHDRGESSLVAAIKGTEEVFWPVVATVLTSVLAFMPLLFIDGQMGDLLGALPIVVACALLMSLIESVLILPSHMGHSLVHRDKVRPGRLANLARGFEARRDRVIRRRVIPGYAAVVERALRLRYVTLVAAIAALVITLGMVAGKRVEFTFLPTSDSETIIIDLRMPIGTPISETEAVVGRIEQAAAQQAETKTVNTYIGISTNVDDTSGVTSGGFGTHIAQLFVELVAVEQRQESGGRESARVIAAIRGATGSIDGVESLKFSEIQGGPAGPDLTLQVSGDDDGQIETVVAEIKQLLGSFDGVYDIADDKSRGQREVKMRLKPGAAGLGFTTADVARQVRAALFGIDAHVFSERREDIDVRVRLDEASRESLSAIENMWVLGADGAHVPLSEIAELTEGTSYAAIRRVDRRRAVSVTADTAPEVNPEEIMPVLAPELERLTREHPGVRIEPAGRQRQFARAFESLPVGFMAALIMIYVILAWLFGSYTQPLAVMMGIPFAIIGVVWGHYLTGYQMTFLSLIGFVALSGIVVNDSLIYVQFFNRLRETGMDLTAALIEAGRNRLRPIFLTTVTTVLGLTPLMLERSFQAKFLIPMAISIAFGLMSATVLILLVLPCIIAIVEDLKAMGRFAWHGARAPRDRPPAQSVLEGEIE